MAKRKPYWVWTEGKGCKACGRGKLFRVVGPGGVGDSIGFEDREGAEDRCEAFNIGYASALRAEEAGLLRGGAVRTKNAGGGVQGAEAGRSSAG